MHAPRRLHAVVGVWGETHVERWAAFSLRTQLSSGNLPALAGRGIRIDYHVFTDEASMPLVAARASALGRYAQVHLHGFSDTRVFGSTFAELMAGQPEGGAKRLVNAGSAQWIIEHALAQEGHPAVAVLDNDFLFSDTALSSAFAMLERGAKASMVPVLRLDAGRCGWTPSSFPCGGPGEPGLSGEAACRLLPDALHSVSRRLDAGHQPFSTYPTSVLWRVGDEGWLCRSLMPHPLMVIPVADRWSPLSTVDYVYASAMHQGDGEVRLPGQGDDIVVFKHTPTAVYDESAATGTRLDDATMARFLYFCTNRAAHRSLVRQPVRLAARRRPEAEPLWAEAEARTLAVVEGWYHHLDRLGSGFDLSHSRFASLWHASHYGPIDDFLCPGRVQQRAATDRELAELMTIVGHAINQKDVYGAIRTLGLRTTGTAPTAQAGKEKGP